MKNLYQTYPVIIKQVHQENQLSKLFTLRFINKGDQLKFQFSPGQFIQISLPPFGEAPFGICSSMKELRRQSYFEISVRKVGSLTTRIHSLKTGDKINVRGPYGVGFPVKKFATRNLLLIGGGCGFVPLRSIINEYFAHPKKFKKIQIFYGCKSVDDILFGREFRKWKRNFDFHLTLDKAAPQVLKSLACDSGVVTKLFAKFKALDQAVAIMVGPPIMYRFVIQELKKLGFKDEDIYLSLERRMHCGVGVCQHCAIGSYYVCKDGPVFSWQQIKDVAGVI